MPAEKRPPESQNDEASSPKQRRVATVVAPERQQPADGEYEERPASEIQQEEHATAGSDSDASDDTGDPQDQGYAHVDLLTIRKEVQCPVCLGIIKKTRTVMECLHRFCRECIDKSMRMGNNECPACRTHCASRRSLRDDPRYDALIAALYPDIRKFEEEELAFHEEDDNRNKQIQDSIAQVLRIQSEALGKKRSANKDAVGTSMTRPQRSCRNVNSKRRGRRRKASPEYQDSDENNDTNGIDKQYEEYEQYEHHTEIKQQRKIRTKTSIVSSHSPSSTNLSVPSSEDNLDQRKEERGLSPGLTCSTDMLAWGSGGIRSNTRSNNVNGGMGRGAQRLRLTKLVDFVRNLDENDKEYVALQTPLKAENVQMLEVRNPDGCCEHQSTLHTSSSSNNNPSEGVDLLQDQLHLLNREDTLSGAVVSCISNAEQLILAYQQKEAT